MSHLTASVVVATRNRVAALEMSLPLLLRQTRLPDEIIVVDSSDDLAPVQALIDRLSANTDVPLTLIPSPPGLPLQRNTGVQAARGDVVIFPDDDSLFYPEAIARYMEVYERDTEGVVAGAAVSSTQVSPLAAPGGDVAETYAAKRHGGLSGLLAALFVYVERNIIKTPYRRCADWLVRDATTPAFVSDMGARIVADMEGFRMSFRRARLLEHPFNEALTYYALGEDKDECYGFVPDYCLVATPEKLVFHHEFPGARHGGYRRGFVEVLNQVYIVCRHAPPGTPPRRAFAPYFALLRLQILLRCTSHYQRERLAGHREAMRRIGGLIAASRAEIDARYTAAMTDVLDGPNGKRL